MCNLKTDWCLIQVGSIYAKESRITGTQGLYIITKELCNLLCIKFVALYFGLVMEVTQSKVKLGEARWFCF